ncbi:MAG: hypothetical protein L3J59_05920 [Methylococcaceae bacterium]|nr:hypothetical protein [Methylococcaceae bacterium]
MAGLPTRSHMGGVGRIWQMIGAARFKVEFDTISGAPSTFDAEVKYWSGAREISEIVVGPGSLRFRAGSCVCVQKIRFRSHTLGQTIRITIR